MTVEVEAKGAAAIVPIMLAIDAIQRLNDEHHSCEHRTASSRVQRRASAARHRFRHNDFIIDDSSNDSETDDSDVSDEVEGDVRSTRRTGLPLVRNANANNAISTGSHKNEVCTSCKTSGKESGRRMMGDCDSSDEGNGDTDGDADADADAAGGGGRNPVRAPKQKRVHRFSPDQALVGELNEDIVASYVIAQLQKIALAIGVISILIRSFLF